MALISCSASSLVSSSPTGWHTTSTMMVSMRVNWRGSETFISSETSLLTGQFQLCARSSTKYIHLHINTMCIVAAAGNKQVGCDNCLLLFGCAGCTL